MSCSDGEAMSRGGGEKKTKRSQDCYCTTAPSTLTTYDQTFTFHKTGTTTIDCSIPYATEVYTTVVVYCTNVPTTLTTYDQTFTVYETGTTTITCPTAPTWTAVAVDCTSAPTTLTTYDQV
jgi:hypothetical protein